MPNIVRVPLGVNLPWYAFDMTLDGVGYHLEMAYQNRSDRWALSIGNAASTPVIQSVPILIDRDLLRIYHHLPVPPGLLMCIDTTGKQQQPTLGSFLTTHVLYYIESGF
ncbi:MAG: hypothetical protein EOO38_00080 [Cytophagaceae bacterium]|nr:MAG: hypothetical protein EOO38_00080 [Cytophagaceae bacterium]